LLYCLPPVHQCHFLYNHYQERHKKTRLIGNTLDFFDGINWKPTNKDWLINVHSLFEFVFDISIVLIEHMNFFICKKMIYIYLKQKSFLIGKINSRYSNHKSFLIVKRNYHIKKCSFCLIKDNSILR
jgi:hypothetical protein